MHEEQIGWEPVKEEWDKLTEKEKSKCVKTCMSHHTVHHRIVAGMGMSESS